MLLFNRSFGKKNRKPQKIKSLILNKTFKIQHNFETWIIDDQHNCLIAVKRLLSFCLYKYFLTIYVFH